MHILGVRGLVWIKYLAEWLDSMLLRDRCVQELR
jgi:hypothetical protein